jgi:tRNA 5-methylaminomethyl-2-thiouridine biosynthesis bifunctional protein
VNSPAHGLLPPQAAGLPAWRVLDTQFDPARLFALWQDWNALAQRPRVLHLVALTTAAPSVAALRAAATPRQQPLADELAAQWTGLLPGFHRLSLADGQLQVTLCVGELQPLLREQRFEADLVRLDGAQPWERWSLKALARCCRRGTALVALATAAGLQQLLRQAGFELHGEQGRYAPLWEIRATRDPWRTQAALPARCVVIGAGLAGASVAAALARRGWQVQVLEAGGDAAAGASGLPAGLLVPHVSRDDGPRSRLTRAGQRLMRAEAARLLRAGADWDGCGVLERRLDGHPGLPAAWPAAGRELSAPAPAWDAPPWHAGTGTNPELWHAQAAWIKPAQLVRAWLRQPGVTLVTHARVDALRRAGGLWQLLDREGRRLAGASHVVLANAADAPRLLAGLHAALPGLRELPPVHAMRGVLTCGLRRPGDAAALPPFPVNGLGSLIPAVPTDEGLAWYAGATYEAADRPGAPAQAHHDLNLDKLRRLLPTAAQRLAPAFAPGQARGWGNTRCVSADRLPLVGPLDDDGQPTLWLSTALGSRGLSFAMLCAELLAARLGAEPWPLEAGLARLLHARRRPGVTDEAF